MNIKETKFEVEKRSILLIQLSGRTSSAVFTAAQIRVRLGSWIISFGLRGLPPRLLPHFDGGWVHCPVPEAPLTRGMPTGPRAFLANSGRVWATALHQVSPKKGLVPYMPVRWGVHQIPQYFADV